MNTIAEEKLDSAIEHVKNAIKNLVDIVVNEVDGYDDYSVGRRRVT